MKSIIVDTCSLFTQAFSRNLKYEGVGATNYRQPGMKLPHKWYLENLWLEQGVHFYSHVCQLCDHNVGQLMRSHYTCRGSTLVCVQASLDKLINYKIIQDFSVVQATVVKVAELTW